MVAAFKTNFLSNECQVYSLYGQTEGRRKAFLFGGASIYLFLKLSLTYGGKVNRYKSGNHPLSTLPVGIGNTLVAFK